ncbi:MAG: hypothetical protein E6J41_00560 [Chloroflexi bacterium]|nr:MAG: hypothetical protein E6J41_00560 [Chloroflexota bacterium]
MHDGGGIDVTPSTLLDASSRITSQADDLRFWVGQVRHQGGAAQSSLDAVLAGGAWSDVTSSWGAALDRLVRALGAYGSNTGAAAVVYENADMSAMPMPAQQRRQVPAPPKVDCSPNLLGQVPAQCNEA